MIKRSGKNISAEEVGLALETHPDVLEAAAFGVPDALRAEEVAAVVALRAAPRSRRSRCGRLRSHAHPLEAPRYVDLPRTALPRLANGKVDRISLVDGFEVGAVWDVTADRVIGDRRLLG